MIHITELISSFPMFGYPFRPPGAPRLRPNVRAAPQEPSISPSTLVLPAHPLPVLAPEAGRENRPVHPFCGPSSPAPSATSRARLRPNPVPVLPPPPPPNCYAATDPDIHWLNNRPYWVHRLLGRGGFGEVHESRGVQGEHHRREFLDAPLTRNSRR